jgi:hypothetical protein
MGIPYIEAEGSNYDIGFAIGRKLKLKIKELIAMEEGNYKKGSGKTLSYHSSRIDDIINESKNHFPSYVEELLGMAKGAEADFNVLFALGCEDELIYNCTSVAGFSKKDIILGHNEDWLRDHLDSLYVCRIRQKNGPDSISLSYAGHLPGFSTGLNSEGCSYTCNSINAKGTNRRGLPWQFLLRACLDSGKYSDLIKIASLENKMIGGNSLIALKGRIFDLEMLPKGYAVIEGGKYMAHTNHILDEGIKPQEKYRAEDSVWRLERANEHLESNEFSFDLVKKILSDHKYRPFSICCHEFEEEGGNPYSTMASVIINTGRKEFYVAHGNPCKSEYVKYTL